MDINEENITEFTLTIPLPSVILTAQQGENRFVKSSLTKQYRETCMLLATSTKHSLKISFPISKKVRIHHTWYCGKNAYEMAAGAKCAKKYRQYRPKDAANAITALKAAIDGIVDAGVLVDDRSDFVEWGKFVRLSTQKQHGGRCEIVLRFEVVDR